MFWCINAVWLARQTLTHKHAQTNTHTQVQWLMRQFSFKTFFNVLTWGGKWRGGRQFWQWNIRGELRVDSKTGADKLIVLFHFYFWSTANL